MTVDDVRGRATISVAECAQLLGVGKDNCYAAVRAGEIPSLRIGRRLVIPVAKLLALIGEDN